MAKDNERSIWPAEKKLNAELVKIKDEAEARRQRDYVAPEATQEQIDEMIGAAAHAAGLSVREYEHMLQQHGGQGHAEEVFEMLASGKAASVKEARALLYRQAGDDANAALAPVRDALSKRRFGGEPDAIDKEIAAEHPRGRRKGKTRAGVTKRSNDWRAGQQQQAESDAAFEGFLDEQQPEQDT